MPGYELSIDKKVKDDTVRVLYPNRCDTVTARIRN